MLSVVPWWSWLVQRQGYSLPLEKSKSIRVQDSKRVPKKGTIAVHGCSALPFGSWLLPLTITCSHTKCSHCIPSPHPFPTWPSLPTHPFILLTRASNILTFHYPSPISFYTCILFSFFCNSLITFWLSGYFQIASYPPPRLKVLCQRQTLVRCFDPSMTAILGPERMLTEYRISSEIIQFQRKQPIYKPLCILIVHAPYNFGGALNQVHGCLQLPALCCMLMLCLLCFPAKPWESQVASNKWLGKCEENLRQRLIPTSVR